MKRFFILMMVICFGAIASYAQTDSLATKVKTTKSEAALMQLDSVSMANVRAIYDKLDKLVPRYKIYQTENIHILLKLDTATGRVWMVQYGTGSNTGFTVPLDNTSLLYSWDIVEAGRYELYPTKNMYNFILVDTQWGDTYQVQWGFEKKTELGLEYISHIRL